MKTLINGAGIAGNALAFWLSRLGHQVTVIERFPRLRDTGLQVDLRGPGINVMKQMGLEDAFRLKTPPEQGLQVVDKTGKRRAYFPANRSGKGFQSFTTDYEIMRGDLCRILYEASMNQTKYIFGDSIKSFEEKNDQVEVCFSNGAVEGFDLLIGADGQGSRIRKMMLGSETADRFYPIKNWYTAYFTIPQPIQAGEKYDAVLYIAPGKRLVVTRRHSPDKLQVYLFCKSESEKLRNAVEEDVSEQKKAFAEIFKGAGWQMPEILEHLKVVDDFYGGIQGLVRMDCWSRGRVALLGDAAYCPSPNTGMGTTSALVGAYVLAGEIKKHCDGSHKDDLANALKGYELKFRPFIDQIQEGISEGRGTDWIPSTPFGIGIMNIILGMTSLLRVDITNLTLREDVKIDLSEYKGILHD